MSFDYSGIGRPFSGQNELLDCFSDMLDLHLYYHYKYHSWVSPDNNIQSMLGVVVSREEFEHKLMNASDNKIYSSLDKEELDELDRVRDCFIERVNATGELKRAIPMMILLDTFKLDCFQLFSVLTLLCCELNTKYEKLFAYIQDDIAKKTPTAEMLIRLWAEPGERLSDYFSYLSHEDVLTKYLLDMGDGAVCTRTVQLSQAAADFLLGNTPEGYRIFTPDTELNPLYINEKIADIAENAVRASGENRTTLIYLSGKRGSGRRFIVKHCAKRVGEKVIMLSAERLVSAENMSDCLNSAVCGRVLRRAALCITDFEKLLDEENSAKLSQFSEALVRSRRWLGTHLFITGESRWQDARLGEEITKIDLELADTDEAERLVLWKSFGVQLCCAEPLDPQEMAAKFRFTPGQVSAAVTRAAEITRLSGEAEVSAEVLHQSCYDQVVLGLNTLATPIKPAYCWEDLVLPPSEVKMLKEACNHIKYRHTVYTEWGFGKKAAYGRGLSMLFSGPPGTGKTMAAQVITNQLHMQMYKVQLSQIVSKYIGETEKNLRQVFTEAKNANCILFFDETDALFGKRSEVKDSHDRHANIETAYLLQQMEEYDGVVLMATNLLQNIDEAFMRRINFVIAFPFPDVPTRKLLWNKMLETAAPISEDVDLDFVAENFRIAGGNIKNCVVHAAFLAAADGSPICMRHILNSVVKEQRKNNAVVLKDDLKQYADLVFGND